MADMEDHDNDTAMDIDDDGDAAAIAAPRIKGGLSEESTRLFRAQRTVTNMLRKRGYMMHSEFLNMTPASFKAKYGEFPDRDVMTMSLEKADDETDQMFVFFIKEEKVGVMPITQILDKMKAEGVHNSIIVLRDGITPFAKRAIDEMEGDFRIEYFKEVELLVDITDHELVPEHKVLTNTEKSDLMKRYKLKDTQLPRIQPHDPVARYFGMKRGQVVKIIRPSETAGRYVTYRVCMGN